METSNDLQAGHASGTIYDLAIETTSAKITPLAAVPTRTKAQTEGILMGRPFDEAYKADVIGHLEDLLRRVREDKVTALVTCHIDTVDEKTGAESMNPYSCAMNKWLALACSTSLEHHMMLGNIERKFSE